MKCKNKIITIFLTIMLFALSVVPGCGKAGGKEIYITKNFSSDYKIVKPLNADLVEDIAAEELQLWIEKSTGVLLPIVSDAGITYNEESKYLSVGKTTIFNSSNITLDKKELGYSGAHIESCGNQVIICGGQATGTLQGVYRLLEKWINFDAITPDIVNYDTVTTLKFEEDFKFTSIPAIDIRNYSTGETQIQTKLLNYARMGLISAYWTGEDFYGRWWGANLNTHTTFTILPPKTYQAEHSSWYICDASGAAKQVDLLNEEMTEQFIENLCTIIEENPNSNNYMIGNEDNRAKGDSDEWNEHIKKYGIGGIYIRFVNKVADAVKERFPDRDIKLSILAYFAFDEPPVIYDAKTETFTPKDPTVIPRDNVMVRYCPHDACHAHCLDDETCPENKNFKIKFLGWRSLTENIAIYDYYNNFTEYMAYYNNIGRIQACARFYGENDVKYFYALSVAVQSAPFNQLKMYLVSKLFIDPELDVNKLTKTFFDSYYGPASQEMLKYYNAIINQWAKNAADAGNSCSRVYTNYGTSWIQSKYWPMALFDNLTEYVNQGYAAIDNANLTQTEKAVFQRSVKQLMLPVTYWMLRYYPGYYTDKEFDDTWNEFLLDCEELKFTRSGHFVSNVTLDTSRK